MSVEPMFNPLLAHRLAISSVGIPDPIEFVISEKFLDRGVLYPRQATLLKTIFLRDDLFTDFDLEVIDGWETTFMRTGNEGISPGIHQRIEINKAAGRSWFKEVLAVIGRRGGKGHLGAICSAYILWHFLNRPGGPQIFYGIDRDKTIAAIVFAGKKDQAKANQWGDLNKFITSAPCFRPYLSKPLAESLTLYSPADLLKIQRQKFDGVRIESDQASFAITPSASTMMAGRGPASAILMFDEMAHIIASGASRSAAEIYNCLDPDTRVLTADLVWKRIDDLAEGESLMAFDEETDGTPGSSRRLREAQVEHKWDTYGLAYRISFDDGTSVVCSGNHRWLASGDQKGKNWSWRSIETPSREGLRGGGNPKSLKVGDLIRKVTTDPWEQETSYESGYLAGMLDGEGHVRWDAGLRVVFTQKPGPVLDRVDRHLGQLGYTTRSHVHAPSGCVNVNVSGIEGLRLIGSLGLTRLAGNLRPQWEGKTFRRAASKKIVSIEPLEEQRLVDLQTSTGTFIAEGLASHNSAMPSLDQFGVDGFSYQGSSPWQMQGQFYDNWQNAIALEPDGTPSFPNMMMIQMPSWNVYLDYERAHELPLRPPTKKWIEVTVPDTMLVNGEETPTTRTEIREVDEVGPTLPPIRSAVQTYDEDMKAKERANPDSFAVEYRCLHPDTRVLKSDLRWVRIDDLQPGDEVFSVDEEGHRNESGRRLERKMRRAIVEAKEDSYSKAYRLTFDDGTSIVCSGNHRWLSSSAGSKTCFRWRSIEPQSKWGPKSVMKVGDTIRYIIEPWEPLETYEAGWLAGLYDGEGCVITRTRHRQEFAVTMTQNPGTVQDRVWSLLEEMGFQPKDGSASTRKARTTRVTGLSRSLRLLGQIRPLRLLENGNPGLWEGRALGHEKGGRYTKTIVSIDPLPEQRLVDIQTSTGTFIAEGLISHNSHWALSLSSYLDEKKVAEAFRPFEDNGTTRTLTMQTRGPLSHYYKAHADPGAVNDNFAFAMGHVERPVGSRFPHVVIDLLKMWKPIDFPDGIVDYPMVTDDLWDIIERFSPDELTFDQFQSVMMIATLNQRMTAEPRPKQTLIFEKPATRPLNWKRAELFKSALNLGLIHIPMLGRDGEVDPAGEMAELELRFLELRNGRVDHPTSGPIQHNDLSDCLFEVVWALIGEELLEMLESPVMSQVSGMGAGGVEPPLPKTPQSDPMQALANANRGAMTQRGMGSARGMRRR